MFNHTHYVPVLKWKQGEYQALSRLTPAVQERITPLFEIPDVGYDHENEQPRESIDDHLGDFGRRLAAKWTGRCFVDLKYIAPNTRLANGAHPVEAVFQLAAQAGCHAVPVINLSLSNDIHFMSAMGNVIRNDRRGACLRLEMADFDRPNFATDIANLLRSLGLSWEDTDLVIDTGTPNYTPAAVYTRLMIELINMIPSLNRWRSFTIAGTSYPELFSAVVTSDNPLTILPRMEWITYKQLVAALPQGARIPSFGDYGVAHPSPLELDMRLVKPFAKLRYTIDDSWHLRRGTPVRTHGFGQYKQLCEQLIAQHYFQGAGFSAGDQYIADCAGGGSTGNLSTWVWVSMNQHMTKVVSDLSTFHGL